MKDNVTLTISTLVTIVLTIFHITSDAAMGIDPAKLSMLLVVTPIVVLFLYATLELAGRRSGFIIILLGSLLALGVSYLHMSSARIAMRATSPGGFFFIWTLLTMAATSLFSIVLCVRGLWRLQRGKPV